MAGKRRFDTETALDRMVETFWARGFEATSVDDLVRATGVQRQSLYNAFGDKDAMFLAALEHYGRRTGGLMDGLTDPEPEAGLRRVVLDHAAALASTGQAGCLLNNACGELGGRTDPLGRSVARGVVETEAQILSALEQWQAAGRLRPGELRPLARYFVALLRGVATVHRATGDANAAAEAGDVGLLALSGWTLARPT